ncbi:MAG: phosphatase PAP2 family protein [Methylococcales bacterium]
MKILGTIQHYDTLCFMHLVSDRLPIRLRRCFQLISKTGDGHWYLLVVLGVTLQQGIGSRFVQGVLIAFLLERPVYFFLKNSLKRNRPQAALEDFKSFIVPHDQFSFPSGHTSAAFLMATLGSDSWPVLSFPLFLWAVSVGFSRVLLGVHFPSDVMVGAILGIGIAFLGLHLVGL